MKDNPVFLMVNMVARSDIIRLLADILPIAYFIVLVIARVSLTKIKRTNVFSSRKSPILPLTFNF